MPTEKENWFYGSDDQAMMGERSFDKKTIQKKDFPEYPKIKKLDENTSMDKLGDLSDIGKSERGHRKKTEK